MLLRVVSGDEELQSGCRLDALGLELRLLWKTAQGWGFSAFYRIWKPSRLPCLSGCVDGAYKMYQ